MADLDAVAAASGSIEAELGARILGSETLRRSGRLKELLAWLLERSAEAPHLPIREHDIGTAVYGRPADYDTAHDTIVRVQVAQLRKKLERYAETEGLHDELILTIPRGGYQPAWRARPAENAPATHSALDDVPPSPVRSSQHLLWAAVVVLAFIAFAAVAFAIRTEMRMDSTENGVSPAVRTFWSRLLVPGKTTNIVLSDPGIVMLAAASGRPVTFPELGDRLFLSRVAALNGAPEFRDLVRGFTSAQLTTLSDVEIVRRITALGRLEDGRAGSATLSVVIARDFRMRELNRDNTVLVGYGLSNPWVQVFEPSLNFRLEKDPEHNNSMVVNREPNVGEQSRYYLADPGRVNPAQGYAIIAFVRNPTQSGNVLIVSGADVPGTEAAIGFLMADTTWRPFVQRISRSAEIPFFEVVLAYRRLSNASGDVSTVAWRVH